MPALVGQVTQRRESSAICMRTPCMNAPMRAGVLDAAARLAVGVALLDAARNVDRPRPHVADRARRRCAASSPPDRISGRGSRARTSRRQPRPVERAAGAARQVAGAERVEQQAGGVVVGDTRILANRRRPSRGTAFT